MQNNIYKNIVESESPLIMGIVNVTPDSFSDGGKFLGLQDAVNHAVKLINEGTDIIDIGGESTRPGAEKVSIDEELKRVIPVIQNLRKNYSDIIISIDTTKSEVAREAVLNGANIINDISGGVFDDNMFHLVSEFDIPYVMMHIKGTPKNMQANPFYSNVVEEVYDFFSIQISKAQENGVEKIIIDPGIGFGKRVADNFNLINNLGRFNNLGYPVLLGLSRKSFLGKSLNLEIDERENATIIMETIGTMKGAQIIRTHNVKNAVQMKKIFESMNISEKPVNV